MKPQVLVLAAILAIPALAGAAGMCPKWKDCPNDPPARVISDGECGSPPKGPCRLPPPPEPACGPGECGGRLWAGTKPAPKPICPLGECETTQLSA